MMRQRFARYHPRLAGFERFRSAWWRSRPPSLHGILVFSSGDFPGQRTFQYRPSAAILGGTSADTARVRDGGVEPEDYRRSRIRSRRPPKVAELSA